MMVTKNFSREEFTHSQTAARRGIVNIPTEPQWLIITGLSEHILEPARDSMGPLKISSGFRCRELNEAIGGAARSDHQVLGDAAAADIVHADLGDLFRFIYWLPWSKLIWEYGRWVHVSWSAAGPPPDRAPWIKDKSRNYEDLTYREIVDL